VLGPPSLPVAPVTGDEPGCAVLEMPDPGGGWLGPAMPEIGRRLRALAAAGHDKLIVDLARVTEVNAELVTHLLRVIRVARSMGMRAAICAADRRVLDGLGGLAASAETPCGPTRAAARERLQQ
jgi:hypothetical protein